MALRLSEGLGIAAPGPKPAENKWSEPKKTDCSSNANCKSEDGFSYRTPVRWCCTSLHLVLAGEGEDSVGRKRTEQTPDYGWPG